MAHKPAPLVVAEAVAVEEEVVGWATAAEAAWAMVVAVGWVMAAESRCHIAGSFQCVCRSGGTSHAG